LNLTVITPENPEMPEIDQKLVEEIPRHIKEIKIKTKEPFGLYKKLTGKKSIKAGFFNQSGKKGILDALFMWIRGNLFIPDARRGWIKPVIRWIKEKYHSHRWDIVITTGPPHSVHLIGLKMKNLFPQIKWIADFRDPWTHIDFYHKLMLTPPADFLHHYYEKKTIRSADIVLSIGRDMLEYFKKLEIKNKNKFFYLPNGYDKNDFPNDINTFSKNKKNPIIFTHTGTINADRNQPVFWAAIFELLAEKPYLKDKIKIRLVGRADAAVWNDIQKLKLNEIIDFIPYVDHKKSIEYLLESDYLLLFINRTPNAKGILTGKIFEYLGSLKKIICIGPEDGEAAQIIEDAKAGICIDFHNKHKIKTVLHDILSGNFTSEKTKIEIIENYSRQNLTRKLIDIIETIVVLK
jgi:glycosyltransferase involved in cell wall biosynthesis